MILVRLSPSPTARIKTLSPEIVADILWAAAIPEDHLEHVRARCGPVGGDIDAALFHKDAGEAPSVGTDVVHVALNLCRRAITVSPTLDGWSAGPLVPASGITAWEPL